MKNVHCACKAWSESANQIFNAQVQQTLMTGVKYTGHQFKFCPWCGRHLTPRPADLPNGYGCTCGSQDGYHSGDCALLSSANR